MTVGTVGREPGKDVINVLVLGHLAEQETSTILGRRSWKHFRYRECGFAAPRKRSKMVRWRRNGSRFLL